MTNLGKLGPTTIFIVYFISFVCASPLNNEGAENAEQTMPDFFGDERRLADPADFWNTIAKAWSSRGHSAQAASTIEKDSQLYPPLPVRGQRLSNNGDFNSNNNNNNQNQNNRRRVAPTYNRLFGFYTAKPQNGNNNNNNGNRPNKPPNASTAKPFSLINVVNKINKYNDDFDDRYNSVLENRALKRKEGQEYSLQRDNSDFFSGFGRRGGQGLPNTNRRSNFFLF